MLFAKTLALGASFVVAALAQTTKISFTTLPTAVKAGESIDLKWIGGDNSPVTIKLRQGRSTDLKDVATITTSGTGGSFTWTPSKSLPDGTDYALQISQGSEINFTGQFSLSGGSGSKTSATESSSASVTESSSASVTKSSSASVTSAATTVSLISSPTTIIVATTKLSLNSTIPIAGTGASFGSSGIPITRNATLSRATLTATKSSAATSSEAGSGGSGSTGGSSAGSNPSATSAPGSSSAANLASPLALLLCALVAVVYLG